jgi:hypothetical protein
MTILSRRTYRQDALATIAIWERGDARWALNELARALAHPTFVLYAGRKCNALGAPLAPVVIEAPTLADAFRNRQGKLPAIRGADVPWGAVGHEVAHDPCDGFDSGLTPLRREFARDGAPQRIRWQFATRPVEIGLLDQPAGADEPRKELR